MSKEKLDRELSSFHCQAMKKYFDSTINEIKYLINKLEGSLEKMPLEREIRTRALIRQHIEIFYSPFVSSNSNCFTLMREGFGECKNCDYRSKYFELTDFYNKTLPPEKVMKLKT